jgi:hypothetical protein
MTGLMWLSRPKHKCACLPSSEDCKLKIKGLHLHQTSRRNTKNWRLHQSTRRRRRPQANKSYPRSLDSSRPQFVSWKPSNSQKIFSGILGSLTLLTLKVSWQGFDKVLLATSTLQLPTLANEDELHLRQSSSLRRNSRYHQWIGRAIVEA